MDLENKKIDSILKNDEIDMMALLRLILSGRRIIGYTILGCITIGLIIAFTSQKKYTVSATLLPSVEKQGGNLGNLSALAGMAGINLGGMVGDASGIPTELYPQVIGSVPYLMELMHEKLTWEKYSNPLSIYDIISIDTVPSAFSRFRKYSIDLPWTIKDAFSKKSNLKETANLSSLQNSESFYSLTPIERAAIAQLKSAIWLIQDKKSNLIIVSVTMGEPLLTAQLADKAVLLLQKHVIEYKTKQSTENLAFIEERYIESKINYEQSQRTFFDYKDSHRNIVSERIDVDYQRLSDSYDIASAIYKNLAQQKEQAKITVKEETPVFKVLDPVVVPLDKSAPQRGTIVIISILLGAFMGIIVVFLLFYLKNHFPNGIGGLKFYINLL